MKPLPNTETKRGPKTPEGKARAMANLRKWKPGQSGNPKGRPKNAGRSIVERMNDFQNFTADEIVAIAEDSQAPFIDVTAAKRLLAAGGYHISGHLPEAQEREAAKLVMDYTDGKPVKRQVAITHEVQSPEHALAELRQLCGLDRLAVGVDEEST